MKINATPTAKRQHRPTLGASHMVKPTAPLLTYTVLVDCWIANTFHKAGSTVQRTARQAKYDLPPHANKLALVVPATAPASPASAG